MTTDLYDGWYPEFECRKCGEPVCSTPGGLCHNCHRQEQIDNDVPDSLPWKYCPECQDYTPQGIDNHKRVCLDCGYCHD